MTSTEIAVPETQTTAVSTWSSEFTKLVVDTLLKPKGRAATGAEVALFAEHVKRTGLDPFSRQICAVFRNSGGQQQMSIQVQIDGLRLQAERTGKYEGQQPIQWCDAEGNWSDVWLKAEPPAAARAAVYKTGMREALVAVATWREFRQTSPMWERMGPHMLAKCAEALALRKAFPNETSGLYTPEETGIGLEGAGTPHVDVAPSGGTVSLPGPTEAEVVDAIQNGEDNAEPPIEATADEPAPTEGTATPAQRRLLFAKTKDAGISELALRDILRIVAGSPHTDRLPKSKVDETLLLASLAAESSVSGDDLDALLAHAAAQEPPLTAEQTAEALADPETFWAAHPVTEVAA